MLAAPNSSLPRCRAVLYWRTEHHMYTQQPRLIHLPPFFTTTARGRRCSHHRDARVRGEAKPHTPQHHHGGREAVFEQEELGSSSFIRDWQRKRGKAPYA